MKPLHPKSVLEHLQLSGVTPEKPIERRVARTYRGVGKLTLKYLEKLGLVVPDKPRICARKTAAQIATAVLRETNRRGVSGNDKRTIREIAARLGLESSAAIDREVLDRINRTNQGELVKTFFYRSCGNGKRRFRHRCRRFLLPEAAPSS